MNDFVQTLVTAITIGSLYALIALGYTMVYGILKFINFAHSDIVVLGAWVSYTVSMHLLPAIGIHEPNAQDTAIPLWVGAVVLLFTTVVCSAVGFTVERLAYRPLRRSPSINVLITAIGVSLLLQNLGIQPWLFGATPRRMPGLWPNRPLFSFSFGGTESVVIGNIDAAIMVLAAVLMLLLQFLVYSTKFGRAMRAVSFNKDAAALMGINVDRVISITFVIGSALAAVAGFLYSMKYPSLSHPAHPVWVLVGLKAFVAAVIGGIGNVRGAVLGGFVIAFVEQFGAFYISSNYRDVYVFGLLILILLVRPTGILGSSVREKV